jgi:hypothetical protein
MPFKLQNAARVLTSTDDTYSAYEKAVELFQLQAWIFAPTPTLRNAARHLATVKMLEHLQTQICPKRPRFKALAADDHFHELFDGFLAAGGWAKLRHTVHVNTFDKRLESGVANSSAVSQVIDFSIRYNPETGPSRKKGGSTMARSIIVKSSYYDIGMGSTKLKKTWVTYERSAPLIYLFRLQGLDSIKPYKVGEKKFASELIAAAQQSADWQALFLAYNAVVLALEPRGYNYEIVDCNLGDGQADLKIDPLPGEVLQRIEEYKSGD